MNYYGPETQIPHEKHYTTQQSLPEFLPPTVQSPKDHQVYKFSLLRAQSPVRSV